MKYKFIQWTGSCFVHVKNEQFAEIFRQTFGEKSKTISNRGDYNMLCVVPFRAFDILTQNSADGSYTSQFPTRCRPVDTDTVYSAPTTCLHYRPRWCFPDRPSPQRPLATIFVFGKPKCHCNAAMNIFSSPSFFWKVRWRHKHNKILARFCRSKNMPIFMLPAPFIPLLSKPRWWKDEFSVKYWILLPVKLYWKNISWKFSKILQKKGWIFSKIFSEKFLLRIRQKAKDISFHLFSCNILLKKGWIFSKNFTEKKDEFSVKFVLKNVSDPQLTVSRICSKKFSVKILMKIHDFSVKFLLKIHPFVSKNFTEKR